MNPLLKSEVKMREKIEIKNFKNKQTYNCHNEKCESDRDREAFQVKFQINSDTHTTEI